MARKEMKVIQMKHAIREDVLTGESIAALALSDEEKVTNA